MKMSWEILVDEEDIELWGVRIQVGLLQSPLITLLIVKASPPLQTTTFCVNTENCPKTECSQHFCTKQRGMYRVFFLTDSPNLGFPYLNFLGGYQLKNTLYKQLQGGGVLQEYTVYAERKYSKCEQKKSESKEMKIFSFFLSP